jgi:two-component system CheB/CheR fusion protein
VLKDILISVTGFFRDAEAFQALKRALVQLLRTKTNGDTIRIWVPGCATGEEAYSIAILLHEQLDKEVNRYNIQIFGTDLDQDAIFRARKGFYPSSTVVDMDPELVDKYFISADNTVQVIKSIREMIVFAKQDLTQDPPFSHLDAISCRNLLIYFNSSLQKKIVPMFHYILNPGGLLFLGKSESFFHHQRGRTGDRAGARLGLRHYQESWGHDRRAERSRPGEPFFYLPPGFFRERDAGARTGKWHYPGQWNHPAGG